MKSRKLNEDERLKQLLLVSRLYYEEGQSKTDISHVIRTSTTQVARLLKEARERKIVKIEYAPPKLEEVAKQLKNKFRWLEEAIVLPSVEDYGHQRQILGKAAAEYFQDQAARTGSKVGISGGNTMFEMIEALPDMKREIHIYPTAIIGRGPTISHIDPMVLVTLLWAKSGRVPGHAHYVTVLPFEKNASQQEIAVDNETFMQRKKVQELYRGMQEVDIIFASIGSVDVEEGYLESTRGSTIDILTETKLTEKELRRQGVVGDINYSYFDKNGSTKQRWNIFLSLGVDHVRDMVMKRKQVIVVVGRYKLEALKAIIQGKLCNVLITDDVAAGELLG